MLRLIATVLLLAVGTGAWTTTSSAATGLAVDAQVCDGLMPNVGPRCLPAVTGSPAIGAGIIAQIQDWYDSGTSQCAGGKSCYVFTGSANSFADYGALTLDGTEVFSFQLVPTENGSGYTGVTTADASFHDVLHFSTGSQVRFTFSAAGAISPTCGSGVTVGFNCDTDSVQVDTGIHVVAGTPGSPRDAVLITVQKVGPAALQILDDLTGLPPAAPHFQSTFCGVGFLCGRLVTDLIPLTGPLELDALITASIRPFLPPAPDTVGGSFATRLVMDRIEVFDAGGNPVTTFTITADSGTSYPLVNGYDMTKRQLTIPLAMTGAATFTDMTVVIGSVVSGPSGTSPQGTMASYDPTTRLLTIPTAYVGATPFYNVVATVSDLVSIASVSGADSFDGTQLYMPSVQVRGGAVYQNVVMIPGRIVGVAGGMPGAVRDQYDPQTGQVLIPAVGYAGKVYTNVTVTVGTIVSVNSTKP